jgi:hypothetical protein
MRHVLANRGRRAASAAVTAAAGAAVTVAVAAKVGSDGTGKLSFLHFKRRLIIKSGAFLFSAMATSTETSESEVDGTQNLNRTFKELKVWPIKRINHPRRFKSLQFRSKPLARSRALPSAA